MLLFIPMDAQQPQTPVQGVVAHIDDGKLFPDSLPPQYRLPEGMTVEDVIRKLPGVEVLSDGSITVNGKLVSKIRLSHQLEAVGSTLQDDIFNAQDKPVAGDTISGIVCDKDGPMMLVGVREFDSTGRIVAKAITDMEGKFSFRLDNPEDRIQITYVGYETVDIPIDRHNFIIKMVDAELIYDDFTIPDTGPHDRGIIGRESYTMEELQKNAPQDYVCGYVMKNPQGTYLYGIYLVKEGKQYSVVYKKFDNSETRSIKSRQAKKLISSVDSKIAYADVPKKTANAVRGNGVVIHVTTFYDGNTAYAVTPDKAAYFWTNGSEDVPDEAWQEEYLKFKNK